MQSKFTPGEAASLWRNCWGNGFHDSSGSGFLTILLEFWMRNTPWGKCGWIATITTVIIAATRTG